MPEATEELRSSLVEHAKRLVARDGASALTMRALAAEAGCSVGLPYKVFTDRHELVLEILNSEFARLGGAEDDLVARAGTRTVGGNLAWYAELLLASTSVALVREVTGDEALADAFATNVHKTGLGPGAWAGAFAAYLAAEQRAGRVAADVDVDAFGFLLAGAVHNLIMSGEPYPRPSRRQLRRLLDGTAAAIAPRQRPAL